MKAFILNAPGEALLAEMPKPELKDEYSAILKPVAVSVCTSDVNTVYGSGSKKPDRLILGHEAVAEVYRTGLKVKDFKEGDLVAVPAMTPDWRNTEIQEGNFLHAGRAFSSNALGRSLPGVFAEYFMVEDADVTLAKIPDTISTEDALMCVDMVTTGFSGVEAADIRFGDTVAVIGIGAVGLMAAAGARLKGAGRIIAVGSRRASLPLALHYGVNNIINYKEADVRSEILEMTQQKGADVVIVCGGNDKVLELAYEIVRYGIGRIVNLKHFPGEEPIPLPKFYSGRGMGGKTLYMELGMGGRARLERLMKVVQYADFKPGKMVTHKLYGFEKLSEALELMRFKGEEVVKTEVLL